MKFSIDFAGKTIRRKPFRAAAMAMLVLFLSFTIFVGAYVVLSLKRGLASYQARLGADIIVVPSSAAGHGTVDDILLQGITGNYYMSGKEIDKIRNIEGIESLTTQFFLTSAKASCCSTRVQIIGFDPETDFSILPWISDSYEKTISDGDIVAGANINVPADRTVTFYGKEYKIAAQLARTGTGLDSAVFTNMNTIRNMAGDASSLLDTSPFKGVDIQTAASAVLIKVADGYEISNVTDDINIHITKVEATSARSMISQIAEGLNGVSRIIGALVVAVWLLALVILIAVFALVSNERRKEFAVLRIMGASKRILFYAMGAEAFLISAFGAIFGLLAALIVVISFTGSLKAILGLPFFAPGAGILACLGLGAFVLSAGAGLLTALLFAHRITKSEAGLLLREDG